MEKDNWNKLLILLLANTVLLVSSERKIIITEEKLQLFGQDITEVEFGENALLSLRGNMVKTLAPMVIENDSLTFEFANKFLQIKDDGSCIIKDQKEAQKGVLLQYNELPSTYPNMPVELVDIIIDYTGGTDAWQHQSKIHRKQNNLKITKFLKNSNENQNNTKSIEFDLSSTICSISLLHDQNFLTRKITQQAIITYDQRIKFFKEDCENGSYFSSLLSYWFNSPLMHESINCKDKGESNQIEIRLKEENYKKIKQINDFLDCKKICIDHFFKEFSIIELAEFLSEVSLYAPHQKDYFDYGLLILSKKINYSLIKTIKENWCYYPETEFLTTDFMAWFNQKDNWSSKVKEIIEKALNLSIRPNPKIIVKAVIKDTDEKIGKIMVFKQKKWQIIFQEKGVKDIQLSPSGMRAIIWYYDSRIWVIDLSKENKSEQIINQDYTSIKVSKMVFNATETIIDVIGNHFPDREKLFLENDLVEKRVGGPFFYEKQPYSWNLSLSLLFLGLNFHSDPTFYKEKCEIIGNKVLLIKEPQNNFHLSIFDLNTKSLLCESPPSFLLDQLEDTPEGILEGANSVGDIRTEFPQLINDTSTRLTGSCESAHCKRRIVIDLLDESEPDIQLINLKEKELIFTFLLKNLFKPTKEILLKYRSLWTVLDDSFQKKYLSQERRGLVTFIKDSLNEENKIAKRKTKKIHLQKEKGNSLWQKVSGKISRMGKTLKKLSTGTRVNQIAKIAIVSGCLVFLFKYLATFFEQAWIKFITFEKINKPNKKY